MKLNALTIDRFKGIRHLEIDFEGRDAAIYGDNATGKTTIYDAFLWLLFGKDSTDRKDFEIQPLDAEGNVAEHGFDTTVAATLMEEDGSTISLRRVYAEKWEKRRGQAQSELTGHTTSYYINDLPVKQGDYKAKIEEIAPEKTFKALTSAEYFCSVLPWQERRKVLFELAGGVAEDAIFAANPGIAKLRADKANHTVEEYKAICQHQRVAYNKELAALPGRIDEASRSITKDAGNPEELTAKYSRLEAEKQKLTDSLARTQSAAEMELQGALNAKNQEVRAAETEARLAKEKARAKAMEEINAAAAVKREEISLTNADLAKAKSEAAMHSRNAQRYAARADELRDRYRRINAEQWSGDLICPTCKRPYAAEDIEAAKKAFEARKQERLEAVRKDGAEAAEEAAAEQKEVDKAQKIVDELTVWMPALYKDLMLVAQEPNIPDDPAMVEKINALRDEAKELENRLAVMANDRKAAEADVRGKIALLSQEMAFTWGAYGKAEDSRRAETRVRELTEYQRTVAAGLECVEEGIAMCDEYTRTMVQLTEEHVDGLFRAVRWKLFDEQINGGLAETCVPTVDGVPYADLNHAAKINSGLDVVQALGKFYGMTAPIFLDNAESVTNFLSINAQIIKLIVSENDEELRIEM